MAKPKMPMAPLPPLSEREIVILKDWIDRGAKWDQPAPAQARAPGDQANASYGEYKERVITDEMRQWWAFKKPVREIRLASTPWSKNPMDQFVKAAMDAKGPDASTRGDRVTLIRRAYLDLTGLLPTPPEADAFVNDRSPRAHEDLVERLLASTTMDRDGDAFGWTWFASPRAPASSMTRARDRLAVSRLPHQAVE